jgi:SAM-dependent methyltransferase
MSLADKPFAESCEQNREPIFRVIRPLLRDCGSVLEIGSGTGQHAVYFAARMPQLQWQTSDCLPCHRGIQAWIDDSGLDNVLPPIELDVLRSPWPQRTFDAVFSANTCHIMHWPEVEAMFDGIGRVLKPGGRLLLYGPFNEHGEYTSASNARFDEWLKARDPQSGIRDFEALDALARRAGMQLQHNYPMPANNRILYWKR